MSRRTLLGMLAVLALAGCHVPVPSDAWPEPVVEVSSESPPSWVLPGGER